MANTKALHLDFEKALEAKILQVASSDDPAHDILHFKRVVRMAKMLWSLRKTKRPFPDSSLAARALLNEGFPGKPYVA